MHGVRQVIESVSGKLHLAFRLATDRLHTVPGFRARLAHELRNEVVDELAPDLVGKSRTELDVELVRDGKNRGMESEKGRR
jgi:hypothetical protein